MRSFFNLALLALPLAGRVACEEPAVSPTHKPKPVYANANEAFQDLLNALPEESLHAALNSLTHFKDGVFESDRHGVEKVHHENPPLATKLIVAAVQDLKKRQNPAPSNGTQPSTPTQQSQAQSDAPSSDAPSSDAPASSQAPSSKAAPPAVVPVPISTTDSNGQATVFTSAILSEATASVAVPVTRTKENGDTEVVTENKPAVIKTATDSAGQPTVITSAVNLAPTPGQVMTTTDAKGSTFLTTYTPDGGKVSSIKLITTTGPDGQPTVVTSYAYVDPAAAETGTDGQPAPTGTETGKPGLQKGAANKNRAMEAAMVGGAVGGAFVMWL